MTDTETGRQTGAARRTRVATVATVAAADASLVQTARRPHDLQRDVQRDLHRHLPRHRAASASCGAARWCWTVDASALTSWFPAPAAAARPTVADADPTDADAYPTGADAEPSVAGEHAPAYQLDPSAAAAVHTSTSPTTHGVATAAVGTAIATIRAAATSPPVVAESERLGRLLAATAVVDAAMAELLSCLADLTDGDEVEQLTGLSAHQWLGFEGGMTSMDRRFLGRATKLLDRLPSLATGVSSGAVTWAQLRGIVLAVRELPQGVDARLDAFVASALERVDGAEPDALVTLVRRAAEELAAACDPDEADAGPGNRLVLQPSLDGRGGRLFGDLDAVALAIVDEATAPGRGQLDHPGGVAGARADNLLARLLSAGEPSTEDAAGTVPPGTVPLGTVPPAPDSDLAADASHAVDHGHAVGQRDAVDHGHAVGQRCAVDLSDAEQQLPPIRLLLRMEYGSLLGEGSVPADILTQLVGGTLRLAAPHARRLLDERGIDLRTVVVDGGEVVGVGRRTRRPPGWLADATLVVHDRCTGPDCARPARGADLDHAVPWWSREGPGGTTDVANIGPLCSTANHEKEAAGWRVTQDASGRRVWHHPRSGVTVATVPATWRPVGWRSLHPPGPRRARATPPSSSTVDAMPVDPSRGGVASDDDVPF